MVSLPRKSPKEEDELNKIGEPVPDCDMNVLRKIGNDAEPKVEKAAITVKYKNE